MASVQTTDGKKVLVGSKAYDKALAEGRIPGKSSSKPKATSSAKSSSREIDTSYFLRPGESVADYNARIATQRSQPAQPVPSTGVDERYFLRPGETIDEYNARIATQRAGGSGVPAADTGSSLYDIAIQNSPLLAEQLRDPAKRAQFEALPDDLKGIYVQTMRSLEGAIEAGKVVNPNIEITPAENRKLLEQARTELEPYYAEQLDFLRDDFETSIDRLTTDVGKAVSRAKDPFAETLRSAAEDEAQAGLTYSSGRLRRENARVDKANQAIEDLVTEARRSATDAATQYERKAGSSALRTLNIPTLNTYQATNRGIVDTGTRRLYEPTTGDALGSIEKEKTTAVEARRSELEDALRRSRILDLAGLS